MFRNIGKAINTGIRGGLGGAIGGFIGNELSSDPSKAYERYSSRGMDEIRRGTNEATGYLEPYRTGGMNALRHYMDMLSSYENPTDKYNDIMSGWEMSSGAKNMLNGALDKVKNEMAARGLTSSGQEFSDLGKTYEDYASRDQDNFLKNILGIEQTGLSGYQGLTNLGERSASESGRYAMEGAGDLASLFGAIARSRSSEAEAERQRNSDFGSGIGNFLRVNKNFESNKKSGGKINWL